MNLGDLTEKMMGMSDEVWERHANPWSVWTRVLILPLLTLAIWSRVWLGWWCLIPISIVVIWIWINPRFFKRPDTTRSWSSKGVLGERVWLNRKTIAIPSHHERFSRILSYVPLLGLLPYAHGLIKLNPWETVLGLSLIVIGKLWFLDRMVWIYEDMKDKSPQYKKWLY